MATKTTTTTEDIESTTEIKTALEAAVTNLKTVKELVRDMDENELAEVKEDLSDALEEIESQYEKILATCETFKEKACKCGKYLFCFAIGAFSIYGIYSALTALFA